MFKLECDNSIEADYGGDGQAKDWQEEQAEKSIPERGNSLAVFEEQVRGDTLVLLLEQPGAL